MLFRSAVHLPDDGLCTDGLFCNGAETCSATLGCAAGTPPPVDDAFACTADSCDEGTDAAVHLPNDALCTDGLFCNGAETCSTTLGCEAGTPPPLDDGVGCTLDSCDELTDSVVHQSGPFGLPGLALPPDQIGQWGPVQSWPAEAIHMLVVATGKVLWWQGSPSPTIQNTYLWDPSSSQNQTITPLTGHMLCMGHCTLADGQVLAMGGFSAGTQSPMAMLFNPFTESWSATSDMSYGRFYPSATTLADGRVFVASGWSSPGHYVTTPEVYEPSSGTWTSLPGAERLLSLYPLDFLLPSGKLLTVGKDAFSGILDLNSQTWQTLPTSGVTSGDGGSAVMYRPGRLLRTGDSDAKVEVIDVTLPSPGWRVVQATTYPRHDANLVILPDGKVFAVGGALNEESPTDPGCAVHQGEIWDPASETWSPTASMQRTRMYHSTAALLPDGRVLSAGGNSLVLGGELNAELYSPAYLFKGPRPVIAAAPAAVRFGEVFRVDTPEAASIGSVAFVRTAATTHNFDENQRYVPAGFTTGAGFLDVTVPSSANLLPPGYYMLFLVDATGVPSVARILLVVADADADGVYDPDDNCPEVANGAAQAGDPAIGNQTDTDGDGDGNACDPDDDGDGLLDAYETNTHVFVSPFDTGTDPRLADSDGDRIPDGVEVEQHWNPNDRNSPVNQVPALDAWGMAILALALSSSGAWAFRRRHRSALPVGSPDRRPSP